MLSPYPRGWGRMAPPSLAYALDPWHPLNRGLVMCLLPCTGIRWNDAAGVNHGTFNGDARFGPGGPLGGVAATFDGSGDYASVGNDAGLDVGNVLTIAAWVRSASSATMAIYGPNGATDGLWFGVNAVDAGSVGANAFGSGTAVYRSVGGLVAQSAWTFVAYRRTGTGSGNSDLYVNGRKLDGSEISVSSSTNFANTTNAKEIGRRGGGTPHYFNGEIAEVRLWNRGLSDGELLELFNWPYAMVRALPDPRMFSFGVQLLGDAGLQGVANVTSGATAIRGGAASLQGVGVLSGDGALAASLNVTDVTAFGDPVSRSGAGDHPRTGFGDGISRTGGKA